MWFECWYCYEWCNWHDCRRYVVEDDYLGGGEGKTTGKMLRDFDLWWWRMRFGMVVVAALVERVKM